MPNLARTKHSPCGAWPLALAPLLLGALISLPAAAQTSSLRSHAVAASGVSSRPALSAKTAAALTLRGAALSAASAPASTPSPAPADTSTKKATPTTSLSNARLATDAAAWRGATPSSQLRYERLPASAMTEVSRNVELQVKSALARSGLNIKPFAGTVEVPAAPAAGGGKGNSETPAPLKLVPMVFVDDPLRFDPTRGVFEGRVAVGLVELGHTGASKRLVESIFFQIIGDVQSEPDGLAVDRTSPPFPPIKVVARDPGASVSLRVMTNLGTDPVTLELPVARAQLALRGKSRLQGLGLETADITLVASDGAASRGVKVALSLDSGSVTPELVTLDEAGTAQATVRSEWVGENLLTASSSRHLDATLTLRFERPWRSIGACVLGSVAGGLMRHGSTRRLGARRRAIELGLGVLCGLLVWALSVLGVNLFAIALPEHGGEVLAFAMGGLGAFFGVKLLDKLSPAG